MPPPCRPRAPAPRWRRDSGIDVRIAGRQRDQVRRRPSDRDPGLNAEIRPDVHGLPRGEHPHPRPRPKRYHDALQEAMRRLVAGGLVPDRAAQPAKVWAHISLADLIDLDAGSALQEEWIARVRAQWAAARAAASVGGGGDGAAWLEGAAAAVFACDAAITPVVTGDINTAVLEDLVRLCVELAGHGPGRCGPGAAGTRTGEADASAGEADASTGARRPAATRPAATVTGWCRSPNGAAKRWSRPSSARRSTLSPVRAGWRRSCGGGSSSPAGRAEPAAGCGVQRGCPGRDPERGPAAGSALPVPRRMLPPKHTLTGRRSAMAWFQGHLLGRALSRPWR